MLALAWHIVYNFQVRRALPLHEALPRAEALAMLKRVLGFGICPARRCLGPFRLERAGDGRFGVVSAGDGRLRLTTACRCSGSAGMEKAFPR